MSSSKKLPKILVIVGPTASGKSSLALRIAKLAQSKIFGKFGLKGAEIVSADSRQIYLGMDIGTAKPKLVASGQWLVASDITHHLVNIRNPDEEYTVAEFKRDATKAIRGILRRKKLPILVGGTGLYVKAVVDNLDIPKASADKNLRKNLELRIKNKGLNNLVEELLMLDPEAAYVVDLKNPRRVVRALEVAITTGKPFTAQQKKGKPLFDALQIGIKLPPEKLREQINRRADEMIRSGLVREVQELVERYGVNRKAFDAIGYREIINCLTTNNINANQPNQRKSEPPQKIAEEIKQNTWKYAKRQMTWFHKDKRIKWTNLSDAEKIVTRFLKN